MLSALWTRTVRFGFRLLYNELAWTYDFVSWVVSLGQWREWQEAGIRFIHGKRVLELAHGPGHMLVRLEELNYDVTGIDLSTAMGRMARRRLDKLRFDLLICRGQAQHLPYPDESFDSVFTTFPAEFIVDTLTLQQVNRVLKSGGRLVIVAQAQLVRGGLLRSILEWLYTITGQRPIKNGGVGSQIWFRAGQRFQAAGFDIKLEEVELPGSNVAVVVAKKR